MKLVGKSAFERVERDQFLLKGHFWGLKPEIRTKKSGDLRLAKTGPSVVHQGAYTWMKFTP
jgi:hypothetical protein